MVERQTDTPEKRKPLRWEGAFLAALAINGNVSKACEAAGVKSRMTAYRARLNHPDFASLWDAAYEQAMDILEEEARRRAHDGLVRYKFDKGKPILHPVTQEPYYELEYSDTLLIFLLKGGRPEKYRERHDVTAGVDVRQRVIEEVVEDDPDGGNASPPVAEAEEFS